MKFGFWTLYDVAWTNEEIAQRAAALGYQGVDLRVTSPGKTPGIGENLTLDSSEEDIARTRSAFDRADVEIRASTATTPAQRPAMPRRMPLSRRRSSPHAELARKLGTSRIRFQVTEAAHAVCPGKAISSTSGGLLAERWMLSPNVNAVVENHPGRASAAQLLATAEKMQDQRIDVEFSPDHVVVMQENVLDLVERYAPYFHHICFADRKVVEEDSASFDGRYYYVRYESCSIGDDFVPGQEMLTKLAHRVSIITCP